MKLAKKLLSCAAVFALTACGGGLGQKISEERALEIATHLSQNKKKMASETKVDFRETDDGETSTLTATLRENLNGDVFYSVKQTENKTITKHYDVYLVGNELYDEVFYVRDYVREQMDGKSIEVITKRDNSEYESLVRRYYYREDTAVYYDLEEADCYMWVQDTLSILKKGPADISFYSKGNDDLSFKIVINNKGDEETETVTFGIYGLVLVEDTGKESEGSSYRYSQKTKYAYGFNITLPNGWQQYLNK